MVIGVLFSGFLAGLFGAIIALTAGFPLWAAIALYPIFGTLGACGFIGFTYSRSEGSVRGDVSEFASEMQ